jgi:4a-hydroxytetrahydrobiopterin dehydratase
MEAMARPTRLEDRDVQQALASLDGWGRSNDEIVKTYECPSFADAIAFVVRIGFLAEKAQHHPDLDIRWRTVKVALTTHDAGGLTELDVALARRIEEEALWPS